MDQRIIRDTCTALALHFLAVENIASLVSKNTPHSHRSIFGVVDNQQLTKNRAGFGYFLRYPKAGAILIKYWLSVYYKSHGWLWGGKTGRQNLIFSSHSASRHCLGRNVVSQATGSRIVACKNSVKPGTPRLNHVACKRLHVNTLPENHQKSLFPAKSTWIPLGTKIVCRILIRYCDTINYIDASKWGGHVF